MPVTLSGRLPANHGLADLLYTLVEHPGHEHYVVARLKCSKTTKLAKDGSITAEVCLTAIEAPDPNMRADAAADLQKLLTELQEQRTGEVPLPLDG